MDQVLERMRRALLDLTRRNRLLNFKGTGRTSLEIVDELPAEVFHRLAVDGKTMQLLAREEGETPGEPTAVAPEWESTRYAEGAAMLLAPLEGGTPARHLDLRLQTGLTGEALQTALVHLAREARSAIEERGTNILYLTIGMVEWSDRAGEQTSRAPLLFLPVQLKRKNVHSRHTVSLVDEEIVTNPSLLELATRVHDVHLPDADVSDESFDLVAYFARVEAVLKDVPGWRLDLEIHLGLFSFAKLLLYRDLDPARWPDDRRLTDHPLLRVLAGVEGAVLPGGEGVPDPSMLDDAIAPRDCWQVVNADSSQHAAILAALRGESLVIQGPPGTGKSQTITNVIAECLAAEKTVLFVAEKAAALEVVKRRLEQVGLGDFVLELHSRSASKRQVLEELKRTLDTPPSARTVDLDDAKEVTRTRERLNAYVRALHAAVGGLACSPFEAMNRAGARRGAPEAVFGIPDLFEWTEDEYDRAVEAIAALDRCLTRVGAPKEHPWRGARATSAGTDVRQKIEERRGPAIEATGALRDEAVRLTDGLKVEVPKSARSLRRLTDDLAIVRDSPRAVAAAVSDPRWDAADPAVTRFLERVRAEAAATGVWSARLTDDAADVSWAEVLLRRRVDAESFLRFLKPSWYADGKRLRAFLRDGALPDVDGQLALLKALEETRKLRDELSTDVAALGDRFGGLSIGRDADPDALETFATTAVAVREIARRGALGESLLKRLLEAPDRAELDERIARARERQERFARAVRHLLLTVQADEAAWWGDALDAVPFDVVTERLEALGGAMEQLHDWVDYVAARAELSAPRLEPFLLWAESKDGAIGRGRLADAFARQFWFLWADRSLAESDALRGHRGEDHVALAERFRAADAAWIEATRHRLRALLRDRRPDFSHDASRESKLGILKHEMRKKRRHLPLRKLFDLCGDVVQSIKPCFMMSPISVAQYLRPGGRTFDVVVFDEASQVEPADAFGAIARGAQVLLIGDEKQLPPTNFFTKMEDDEAAEDEIGSAVDVESILGVGAVRFAARNQSSLRWHYRSLHQSLIEFSNARFYDHRLKIFPSPRTGRDESGLAFRYLPDAVYRRGEGVNPDEARIVAEAVLAHATEHPDQTLGVGAFSVTQQRAIEDEVERLLRTTRDDAAEAFFRNDAAEPFFVKNLETIQGDERDVIFLSVGYGPDADGKVSMNFGPLNKDGGWRRLNVLVTRARRRCVVFSSMRADDIRAGASNAPGVTALKAYLATAEAGELVDVPRAEVSADAPLAEAVAVGLERRGWTVHRQVGVTGFSVDLAVVHPDDPGRYVLGVECDGASYHAAATARDRDRIRTEVLVGRGWAVETVWSTDWYKRPEADLDRLSERIEALVKRGPKRLPPRAAPASDASESPPADSASESGAAPDGPPEGTVAYSVSTARTLGTHEDLASRTPARLRDDVARVVKDEGPIHVEAALRVLAGWFDTRATAKTRAAFETGAAVAIEKGLVVRRGAFLWPPELETVPVRWRGVDGSVTDVDQIPPEEIAAAVRLAIAKELGIRPEAVAASVRRLFGFGTTGGKLTAAVDAAVGRLTEAGELVVDGAGFVSRV